MESTFLGLLSLTFHHILLSSPLFKRSMEPSSSFRTLKVFTLRSFPLFMASFVMERIVLPSGIGFVAFKTTPEGSSLASGFYLRSFQRRRNFYGPRVLLPQVSQDHEIHLLSFHFFLISPFFMTLSEEHRQ